MTIRFKTTPEPKDIEELKYFRVVLMAVDGFSGQEITTLRKLKIRTLNNHIGKPK
ncbi:hypothetical protein H9W95_18935 [Flavobacterium lindanitolerans]|nr:hypothetical protein [Flavobacterium lindanitolerans]